MRHLAGDDPGDGPQDERHGDDGDPDGLAQPWDLRGGREDGIGQAIKPATCRE